MARSGLTWKILRIFQSQFLFGEVRDETRHSSYTKRRPQYEKNDIHYTFCYYICDFLFL